MFGRRSVYKLPLSDVTLSTAEKFEAIVVGGGVAGCLVAGKLLSERCNALVIERGTNVLTRPDWHYNMPACTMLNRYRNPSYVHNTPQTVDKEKLASILAQAEGFNSIAAGAADSKDGKKDEKAPAAPRIIPSSFDLKTPNVLGGSQVVLGGRTWFRGVAADWEENGPTTTPGLPWKFDPQFMTQLRRLEAIPPKTESRMKGFEGWSPTTATLRGKRGPFKLSRPVQLSKLHRPVLEALVNRGCTLTGEWDPDKLPESVGAGRINTVMTHQLGGAALSTLTTFLAPHLELTNCVTQGDVQALVVDPETPETVRGVVFVNDKGEEQTVYADRVILTAGAASTPRILLETQRRNPVAVKQLPASVGAGLWTCPTVTLRYNFNQELSLASASNPVVQALSLLEWRRNSSGWGMSAFDDMVCFLDTKTNGPSSVRVNVQPFMSTPDYEMDAAPKERGGVEPEHGFQLVVRLVRPKSRGSYSVTAEKGVVSDFGALQHEDDVAALKEAVQFVSSGIAQYFDGSKLAMRATPRSADFSLDGPHGGGCVAGGAGPVDEDTFCVEGFDNVFVGDSSLSPHGQAADSYLLTMCLADMLHAASLGRKLGSLDD